MLEYFALCAEFWARHDRLEAWAGEVVTELGGVASGIADQHDRALQEEAGMGIVVAVHVEALEDSRCWRPGGAPGTPSSGARALA